MMTLSKINRGRNAYHTPDYFGGVLDSFLNDTFIPAKCSSSVATNIRETDKEFLLEFAIPGYNKSDVNINIEDDLLKVTGKKETKIEEDNSKYNRREFSFGEFEKSFNLPETVNIEQIKANFKNGILSIELPKKEPAKPVSIHIDVK